jgi:hypothetical protein
MAFDENGYNTIGGHSRRGTAIQIFSYKTNDTLTDILTDGYFNPLRHKVKKDDLIFVHREDTDGQNPADLILKITLAPISENITVGNAMSDDWSDDGDKLTPLIDGRDVSTGSGDLITNDATFNALDASKIVHTDGDKKLVSIDINTAYNKDFKTTTPAPDSDSGAPGTELTPPKGNHSHPKVTATTEIRGQVELATDGETQTGTDTERAVTPSSLSSRTALEDRTGIAELATQGETDAETDDTRIVTPLKLAGKKASQVEAEAATDNVKIMTPLRTKQYAHYNLATTLVTIANNSGDPNNDIDFSAGRMWNTAKTELSNLPAYTKQLDAVFAEGDDAGMLRSGVSKTADTWYYIYAITKNANPTVKDYYADTDSAGANVPTGWSLYCEINEILTDGSGNIEQFNQYGYSMFWKTGKLSYGGTGSTTAVTRTATVPPNREVLVCLAETLEINKANTFVHSLLTSLDQTDVAPSTTNFTTSAKASGVDGIRASSSSVWVKTNTSAQYRSRESHITTVNIYISTLCWEIIRSD